MAHLHMHTCVLCCVVLLCKNFYKFCTTNKMSQKSEFVDCDGDRNEGKFGICKEFFVYMICGGVAEVVEGVNGGESVKLQCIAECE